MGELDRPGKDNQLKLRVKRQILAIGQACHDFRRAGEQTIAKLEAHNAMTEAELAKQADLWTDKRKNQYRVERQAEAKSMVRSEIEQARSKCRPRVESMIQSVDRRLDNYFAEMPRPQFVQTLASYAQLGIRLEDSEFDSLLASCECYKEAVLVDRFAQGRRTPAPDQYTVEETMEALNGGTKLTSQGRTIADPYYLDVKSESEIRKGWREFSESARKVLSDYCGDRGQLIPYTDGTVPEGLRVETGISFFDPGWSDDLLRLIDKDVNGILADHSRIQTADERAFVDLLIGTKTGKEARKQAIELAKCDDMMRELFECDPRYSEAVKEAMSSEEDGEA